MHTPPPPPPPPPPASTQPAPPAARPAPTSWWRQPAADLLDVLLVAVVGVLVGSAVAGILLAGASDDPWSGLGAVLLGLGAGLLAALVAWVAMLAVVVRGGRTPGSKAAGAPDGNVLAIAARHVAVVVVLWAAAAVVAATIEPWPVGPLGGGAAAAVGAAAALAAWGRGAVSGRLRWVGIVAVVGVLVAGAVPDRAPYPWELRQEAEAALLATMVDDPAARRVCESAGGAAAGPLASHATEPCYDPDREWLVDRHHGVVAEQLVVVTARVLGPHDSAEVVDTPNGREVRIGSVAVATVVSRDGCASLVVVGPGASSASGWNEVDCR